MKRFNPRFALFGIAISSFLLLASCGGSGSSSSTAPTNTKTTFSVSNKTAVDFTEISVEEGFTGKSLYSGSFKCASQASNCILFYTGTAFKGPVVITFKDIHGHIAAAYDAPEPPGNYLAAEVSLWTTGAYLVEALKIRNSSIANLSQGDFENRLNLFTQNYTNPDAGVYDQNYVDVARHYVNKLQSDSLTIDVFLDTLAQRLINQEVATASEFMIATNQSSWLNFTYAFDRLLRRINTIELIGSAHAQNTDCSSSTVAFLTVGGSLAGGVSNAFPLAGSVVSAAFSLGMNSCTNIVSKLNEIMSQLTNLQNSLDNLQDNMGRLTNFIAGSSINTNLDSFTVVSKDLVQLSGNRQVILTNNNVNSLIEYVKLRGGSGPDALKIALEKDGTDSIFQDLLSRITSTNTRNYLAQIEGLTDTQFDTLLNALNLMCKDPGPGSSVIKQRVQCNMVIATTTSRLIASQNMAYQLASETYDLLEAYPSEATRFGYSINESAVKQKAALLAKLQAQREALIIRYRSTIKNPDGTGGYYNSFNGLPAAMLSNMVSVGCYNQKFPKVANVSAWVKEGADEYVETSCFTWGAQVLSRYYIRTGNADVSGRDDVTNILGVLIQSANVDPWKTSGNTGYTLPQINMIAMKHASSAPFPGGFAFNGENLKANTPKVVRANNLGPINRIQLWTTPWANEVLKAQGLSLYNKPNDFIYEGMNNWIRYTDNNGYSYVFDLHSGQSNALLLCVTADCSKLSSGGISFKNGPQDLSLQNAEQPVTDRKLFGWTIGGKFIDAQ